jgi:hypothetical protein
VNQPYPKAFDYIADFVRSLLPDARLEWAGVENLAITNGDARVIARFGHSELEDLERVLEGDLPVRYSKGIKNDFHFHIYLVLSGERMLPADVKISTAMLSDERDWLPECVLREPRFDTKLARYLYQGLKTLATSLASTLEADVDLPEVQRELDVVNGLAGYYEKHKHLNDRDVSRLSLSYLKAAAVCAIIDLEDKRSKTPLQRLRDAYNEEICSIVQYFRADPLKRIKLPPAIYDLTAVQAHSRENLLLPLHPAREERQTDQIKLDRLLTQLSPRLKERRIGAWEALRSDNPDRLSQAANSMVEVLDQVIAQKCKEMSLDSFLEAKYSSHRQTDWVERTRAWIGGTKTSLQGTKHETNAQSERLTEELLRSAESIMSVILE